jgi:hypothetical protein
MDCASTKAIQSFPQGEITAYLFGVLNAKVENTQRNQAKPPIVNAIAQSLNFTILFQFTFAVGMPIRILELSGRKTWTMPPVVFSAEGPSFALAKINQGKCCSTLDFR